MGRIVQIMRRCRFSHLLVVFAAFIITRYVMHILGLWTPHVHGQAERFYSGFPNRSTDLNQQTVAPRITPENASDGVNIYRIMKETCTSTLELPQDEVLKIISSKKFPGTEHYIEELFPPSINRELPDMPEHPVFVTGFSSNHYREALILLDNFNRSVRVRYPHFRLYIYDIGLSTVERQQIKAICNCTFRTFQFDRFPEHVTILKGYTWKPLIIQLMIAEHPFLVWMDCSVRFDTFNVDSMVQQAKQFRALSRSATALVASRSVQDTFERLKEEPCVYRDLKIFQATFIVLYATSYEVEYLLKPWVACALMPGCMVTFTDPMLHKNCTGVTRDHPFGCHRFDQAVWSILLHRLYHKDVSNHHIDGKFIRGPNMPA